MSQISKGKVLDAAEPFYDSNTGKLLEVRRRLDHRGKLWRPDRVHGLAQRATTSQISQQR